MMFEWGFFGHSMHWIKMVIFPDRLDDVRFIQALGYTKVKVNGSEDLYRHPHNPDELSTCKSITHEFIVSTLRKAIADVYSRHKS